VLHDTRSQRITLHTSYVTSLQMPATPMLTLCIPCDTCSSRLLQGRQAGCWIVTLPDAAAQPQGGQCSWQPSARRRRCGLCGQHRHAVRHPAAGLRARARHQRHAVRHTDAAGLCRGGCSAGGRGHAATTTAASAPARAEGGRGSMYAQHPAASAAGTTTASSSCHVRQQRAQGAAPCPAVSCAAAAHCGTRASSTRYSDAQHRGHTAAGCGTSAAASHAGLSCGWCQQLPSNAQAA
jgi:hypothetical protein